MNPFTLKNKVILITGASSGIGRQSAVTCSMLGAKVILCGRNEERLLETQSFLKDSQTHYILSFDLNNLEQTENIIRTEIAKFGRIDGMINSAGISTTMPFNAVLPKKMEDFFKTNVYGPMNLTRHIVKSANFAKEGGSIVFISSIMGVVGEKGKSLYSMTKGALIAAVKSLAIEFANRRIRVNSISPGVVETPMSMNAVYSRNEIALKKIQDLHPLGLGRAEDVANASVFLLSDASRWITGSNMVVDGGYLAK